MICKRNALNENVPTVTPHRQPYANIRNRSGQWRMQSRMNELRCQPYRVLDIDSACWTYNVNTVPVHVTTVCKITFTECFWGAKQSTASMSGLGVRVRPSHNTHCDTRVYTVYVIYMGINWQHTTVFNISSSMSEKRTFLMIMLSFVCVNDSSKGCVS